MKYFISFLFLFLHGPCFSQNPADQILNRHKDFLLQTATPGNTTPIINTYDASTRQWKNIDYKNTNRSGWVVSDHLRNIFALALDFSTPSSKNFKSPQLLSLIKQALDHWEEKQYQSDNWWHNEIGVPQLIRNILVLLHDALTAADMQRYLKVMAQHKVKGTGANLVWSADIGIFYSLFTKDYEKLTQYQKLIADEVKISAAEGLKPDFSFQQHGERLQMYQYGAAFLQDNIRLAWELNKTQWQYTPQKIDLLVKMLLKGWQWMSRGTNTVPGSMDRSATRPGTLKAADIREYIPFLKELKPEISQQLEGLLKDQNTNATSLRGFTYFPYSDFTTYQQKEFSFFIKTISSRTLATESINSENLKGKLLNSGDHYFIKTGTEYFNLMPAWNWAYLPGVTSFAGADKIVRKPFSGSVSNGSSGATCMDYQLEDKDENKKIALKKMWINHQNLMICLISEIEGTKVSNAYTTLDQSRLQGPVFEGSKQLKQGNHTLKNMRYLYHNNFVYLPLYPNETIELLTDAASGSWYSINQSYSKDIVTEKIFRPVLTHQKTTGFRSSGYGIACVKDAKAADRFYKHSNWKIISNTSNSQAVLLEDGALFASFYTPGTLILPNKTVLIVNKACMLQVTNTSIFVSDPAHIGSTVQITYKNKQYSALLPKDGTSIAVKL